MIEGQEVIERTNSPTFCWRSTNKGSFSTDMYGCIFHLFCVWYNFCNVFSSKTACGPLQTTWWTALDHQWSTDHSLKTLLYVLMLQAQATVSTVLRKTQIA
jgi:hypothetical protein